MQTYVALLRGINVGGNKKIKMADLRSMFEAAGCEDVSTYIQSGNVIFRSSEKAPSLTKAVEQSIEDAAGFHSDVMLRTAKELAAVIAGNPWSDQEIEGTHLVVRFFKTAPPAKAFASIDREAFAPEEFVLKKRELYLHLPDGQGRSKLLEAMGKVKVAESTTARNWKSITKLLELANETHAAALG